MLSRLVQGSQTLDRFDPETLLLLLLLRCIVDSLREQIRDILDRSHENYLFFRKSETRQLVSNVKSREPLTDVRSSSDRRGGMRNITTLNYPLSPRIAFGIADFPPWTFKFHLPTHYVTRSTNSWNHLIASASRRPSVPPPEKLTPHYQQQVEQSTSHFPALPSSVFIHGSKGPQGWERSFSSAVTTTWRRRSRGRCRVRHLTPSLLALADRLRIDSSRSPARIFAEKSFTQWHKGGERRKGERKKRHSRRVLRSRGGGDARALP